MRTEKLLTAIVAFAAFFTFACSDKSEKPITNAAPSKNDNSNIQAANDRKGHEEHAIESDFKVEMKTQPEKVDAGKEVELTFTVKDKSGAQIKSFKTVHEKKMHLILVANDLNEFEHLHPDLQADGSFKIKHIFKGGGKYIFYADATPETGSQVVGRIEQMVGGPERTRKEPVVDTQLKKSEEGISLEMKPDGELKSNQNTKINFVFTDEKTGKPVTDLQNYLGEKAHVVAISEDTNEFLHVHPQSNDIKGETSVSAQTEFPKAGNYKMWVQFQRRGKVIVIPFVVKVAEGEKMKMSGTSAKPENGVVKIKVNGDGYTPSSIELKKGEAVKLVFLREDANNCGDEVIFQKLNITKKLEVGKEVAVDIKPSESGEIAFNCGMNMFKGKIIVE